MILKLRAVLGDDFVASYQGCHGAGSFSGPRARGPGPDTKRDPGGTPKLIIFQLSKGGPLFEKKSVIKSKKKFLLYFVSFGLKNMFTKFQTGFWCLRGSIDQNK